MFYDDTTNAEVFNDHFCSALTNESDHVDATDFSKHLHHYPLFAFSLTFTEVS